ncbi:hypothetical protein CMI48_00355 [Candidatus Pacearchaeota archaeon]|nr:hypothetical protein [Candidatus Pacearchaeota archaeon]
MKAIILTIIILAAVFLLAGKSNTGGDYLAIPLADITTTASFYEHDGIKFFVVQAQDGSIKTAFDACDVCHGSKKGYRQEGDNMICNNCGNSYPISGLGTENTKGGGCWPGYLPTTTQGQNLIISLSDIEKGRYRF